MQGVVKPVQFRPICPISTVRSSVVIAPSPSMSQRTWYGSSGSTAIVPSSETSAPASFTVTRLSPVTSPGCSVRSMRPDTWSSALPASSRSPTRRMQ
jgi:hypothetical protein